MTKVIHIINSLDSGGAENMLYKYISNSNKEYLKHEVVSLLPGSYYKERLEELNIPVYQFNIKKHPIKTLAALISLTRKCAIISTWLYASDFIGALVGKINNKEVIWNIRHSSIEKELNSTSTNLLLKLNKKLSKTVSLITYNSRVSQENHLSLGYNSRNCLVNNGFIIEDYQFNQASRARLRKEYNIGDQQVLISVGRFHKIKGYDILLDAYRKYNDYNSKTLLFLLGKGMTDDNQDLIKIISENKLEKKVILCGEVNTVSDYLSLSDIYVSASNGESFSNSIAEAKINGLPVVATNVGNNSDLLSKNDIIVNVKNSDELFEALKYIKQKDLANRVVEEHMFDYSIENVAKQFDSIILEVEKNVEN